MIEFWYAACYLRISELQSWCEKFIVSKLAKENYLILFNDVMNMGCDVVYAKLAAVIVEDFARFKTKRMFLNLPAGVVIKIIEKFQNFAYSYQESKFLDSIIKSVFNWLKQNEADEVGSYKVHLYKNLDQISHVSTDGADQIYCFNDDDVRIFVSEQRAASKPRIIECLKSHTPDHMLDSEYMSKIQLKQK